MPTRKKKMMKSSIKLAQNIFKSQCNEHNHREQTLPRHGTTGRKTEKTEVTRLRKAKTIETEISDDIRNKRNRNSRFEVV